MQKVINGIALLSGLVSLGVVVSGTYLYLNKDRMIEEAKQQAIEEVTKTVTGAVTGKLPGMIKTAIPPMPKMPTKTGPVLDFEKGFTGSAVPSL